MRAMHSYNSVAAAQIYIGYVTRKVYIFYISIEEPVNGDFRKVVAYQRAAQWQCIIARL